MCLLVVERTMTDSLASYTRTLETALWYVYIYLFVRNDDVHNHRKCCYAWLRSSFGVSVMLVEVVVVRVLKGERSSA